MATEIMNGENGGAQPDKETATTFRLDVADWIDPQKQAHREVLARLQGNILKSHGRKHVRLLVLSFNNKKVEDFKGNKLGQDKKGEFVKNEQDRIKDWIAWFTRRFVTSGLRQLTESEERHATKKDTRRGMEGRVFGSFYLTYEGYRKLGFRDNQLTGLVGQGTERDSPQITFKDGLGRAWSALEDPAPAEWEPGYGAREIHAMLLLADDDSKWLGRVQRFVEESLPRTVEIVAREYGIRLTQEFSNSKDEAVVEHFGFRDGISQPLFVQPRNGAGGTDQAARPSIVLRLDPLGDGEHSLGSYLVYRKLGQEVDDFNEEIEAKALELARKFSEAASPLRPGVSDDEEEERRHLWRWKVATEFWMYLARAEVGGGIIGRYPNGGPLTTLCQPLTQHPEPLKQASADFWVRPHAELAPWCEHVDWEVKTAATKPPTDVIPLLREALELPALSDVERYNRPHGVLVYDQTKASPRSEADRNAFWIECAKGLQSAATPRQNANLTEFKYADADQHGGQCPLAAHGRQMNPPDFNNGGQRSNRHRIVRRGIPYGDPRSEDDKGLLFMSFQSNIADQFGWLQVNWANASGAPENNSGLDKLIGQRTSQPPKYVTMKGGEFFFAPSIPFLLSLESEKSGDGQ